MYNLAWLYENGDGCVKNLQKAYELYKSASNLGQNDAFEKVKSLNSKLNK